MESLRLFLILLLILLLELLIVFSLFLTLFIAHILDYFLERIRRIKKLSLEKSIYHLFENPDIPKKVRFKGYPLLVVLEAFDRRIMGERWYRLKKELVLSYLMNKALQQIDSPLMKRRNFAVRTLALLPEKEYEELLLRRLNDSSFLVKSIAGKALVTMQSTEGMRRIFFMMSQEKGYAYFYYKDILLQAKAESLSALVSFVSQKPSREILVSGLDLFAEKTITTMMPFLKTAFASQDEELILLGIKVLEKNYYDQKEALLKSFIHHPSQKIKAEALLALSQFPSEENKTLLKNSLEDSPWKVRLFALVALKRMGETAYLEKQARSEDEALKKLSQYVIDFRDC